MENEILRGLWQKLANAAADQRLDAFRQYCRKAVELKQHEELTMEDSAYAIAGAMQFDELEADPTASEIIELSGRLELPAENYHGDKQADWQRLEELVKKL